MAAGPCVYLGAMAATSASGPKPSPESPHSSERGSTAIATILALGVLGGTLTWWALKSGGYFGRVMYPGVALLGLGLVVLLAAAPWRASLALSSRARLALYSLLALGFWSLSSALWSPTPDIAVEDAQRIVGYALFFGLGIWGCALLGRRMELSMLPVVGAAGIAAIVALAAMSGASEPLPYLEDDGTLQYPLGYRNANAAFFLIALWPAISLASMPRVATAGRVGAFVTASACIQIALLAQSRGSILAMAAALLVYILASRRRLLALAWLALAALPAAFSLLDAAALFDAAKATENLEGAVDQMNAAGRSGLLRLGVAAAICLVALRLEPRVRPSVVWVRRVAIAAIVVVGVGVIAIVGNPVTWIGDRAEEFFEGEPDLSGDATRLTFNAGSNRSEIWRVALDVGADDPIFGEGGGGFQFRFNRERNDPDQLARDAHSVELEMFSELGVVGLALFGAAVVGAFAGAIRARRLGPSAAALSGGALGAGTYWLVHSSIDWFWPYPAVTAPAFLLLGAAVAPTLLMPERTSRAKGRRALLTVTAVFTLTLVPPLLSELLVERSFDTFRADTEQAYEDLELARDLNPLSDMPALTEGSIALALRNRERAIAAFREAIRMRPEEYVGHFFLALLYARDDPGQARVALAVVSELNPLEARIDEIRKRIAAAERKG